MTFVDEIDTICTELFEVVGPRGPSGDPPVDEDDVKYQTYVATYRLGSLLWAAISAEREQPALRAIRKALEARINAVAVDLVWKARADVQWLTEIPDSPPTLALWSRNWFVRAGFALPPESARVLFAVWWRRFGELIRRLVLTHTDACLSRSADLSGEQEVPRDCDLLLARYELSEFWRYAAADAKLQGGDYYVHPDVSDAWRAFGDNPTFLSAEQLCTAMPGAYEYFVACAPGGYTYELDRIRRGNQFEKAAVNP